MTVGEERPYQREAAMAAVSWAVLETWPAIEGQACAEYASQRLTVRRPLSGTVSRSLGGRIFARTWTAPLEVSLSRTPFRDSRRNLGHSP
jgi:hypothetical protein